MSKKVTRLYEQFQPEHYDLLVDVDPDKMTFSGHVVISGKKVGRPSQRITFHQKGLRITEATLRRDDKKGEKLYKLSRINNQDSYDEVRLHADEMIYPGHYVIMMYFEGKITRNMEGIYPSFFKQNGKDAKIISTQFESHHAREAFPCIDEPEAKATFDLVLGTPIVAGVLGNTPVTKQIFAKKQADEYQPTKSKDATHQRTFFATTPKMSTYLLAFAFGDIKYLESKTSQGVLVRTYATPDNYKHTDFALDVAVKCLEFYNDYFGIDYPLEKCDLIALPDFASGAMENWGLITFREQCLLADPKNTSIDVKQYVAMVVAHELAHQWFGNLVTMRWWTDLWLNEGFASWIEYLAIDHIFPEWQMWPQFIASEQQQALSLDALENSHPIEVPINHPDEIRTIFDAISYAKGSSVIHMLQKYLGADTFRDGLRLYLKKHQYANTGTSDLWAALSEVSGEDVGGFMNKWTAQTGFPLVSASQDGDKITLEQQRFLLNPSAEKSSETWPVPLLTTPSDRTLLAEKTKSFKLKSSDDFKLNLGGSGLYRTSYDEKLLASVAQRIKSGELAPEDRLGLLSDSFESAKAGLATTTSALELLASYADEDSPVVWDIIAGDLSSIRRVMDDEKLNDSMKPYTKKLVAGQLARLGWEKLDGESYYDSLLRPTILGLASWGEETSVVERALELFNKAEKPEDVEPDLRGVVYGTAARVGSAKDFDKMLAQHNASSSSEARLTLTAALTGFKQPELTEKALSQITTENVRLQDAAYWVAYALGNRYAKNLAWDWLQKNWEWLDKNLGADLSFSRFPMYAARSFSTKEFLEKYLAFFESKKSPMLARAIDQGLESLTWQIAWRTRDHESIKKYFS